MPLAPQIVAVTCPACGQRFTAEVYRIIDVGQNPHYRPLFLRGELNQVICPHCQKGGMLAMPFLYHDPGKELALVFLPSSLGLPEADEQRLIGSLTNEVMMSLPPEQRKGYLFQPQLFFRLEALMERVLAADGITPEMLAAQRARMELVERFLAVQDDEAQFKALAEEQKQALDYEFFHTLTTALDAAQEDGEVELAQKLLRLRTTLLELSDVGRSVQAQQKLYEGLSQGMSREEALEQLLAIEGEPELQGAVALARPLLDYQFFLMLSDRIDATSGEEGERLSQFRERLLSLIEEVDKATEAALAKSWKVLQDILKSADRQKTIREHLADIDDVLLGLLSSQIREAETLKREERVADLKGVWQAIVAVLEEAMPPEVQLVNQLLNAVTPEERRALMEGKAGLITPEFPDLIEAMASNLEERGQSESAQRLRMIGDEVRSFVEVRGTVLR